MALEPSGNRRLLFQVGYSRVGKKGEGVSVRREGTEAG